MIDRDELVAFLRFWGPLDDTTKSGDEKKTWKADLRGQLETRDNETLDAFAARMQARYTRTRQPANRLPGGRTRSSCSLVCSPPAPH